MGATVSEAERVIEEIRQAFATTTRPPDPFLVGSREGCEPEESVAPFHGRDWRDLDAPMLDANYTALSFFSEGGFRYFLPAFMIADLRDGLRTADPVFHLTQGFASFETTIEVDGRPWPRRHGGDVPLNPRRYGAIVWRDHARFRLSVFSREEAAAIVSYLRWRASKEEDDENRRTIETALREFWLERCERAPAAADLDAHVAAEQAFTDAWLQRNRLK
jgi:hypothetical protein